MTVQYKGIVPKGDAEQGDVVFINENVELGIFKGYLDAYSVIIKILGSGKIIVKYLHEFSLVAKKNNLIESMESISKEPMIFKTRPEEKKTDDA